VFGARKVVRGVLVLSLGTTLVRGAKKLLFVAGDPEFGAAKLLLVCGLGLGAANVCLFEGEFRDGARKLLLVRGVPAFGALKDCLFVCWLPEGTKRLTG